MKLDPMLASVLILGTVSCGAWADEPPPHFPETRLVKDLRTGVAPTSSYPLPVAIGSLGMPSNNLHFWADDGLHGREPWITDGTSDGLRMLADICPGPCSSEVSSVTSTIQPSPFVDGSHLLVADDGTAGAQLWSLGEDHSITRLTAFCASSEGEVNASCDSVITLSDLLLDDGRLLFSVRSISGSWSGAWATDGTPEGTSRLWEPSDIGNLVVRDFYRAGEWIVFQGYSSTLGTEWYRTDYTASSPELIAEVCPGPCPVTTAGGLQIGESVIFEWFSETDFEWKTWVTGGTAETTHRLFQDCDASCPSDPGPISAVGDLAYFFDDSHIWSTDGTTTGTRRLKARPASLGFLYSPITTIGSDLALLAGDDAYDGHLWRLIDPKGPAPTFLDLGEVSDSGGQLVSNGDLLLVLPNRSPHADIWLSDGSASGTTPVRIDDSPDSGRSHPAFGHAVDGSFFFSAWHSDFGRELWISDGSAAGTRLAHDLIGDPASSSPASFTPLADLVLFTAEATAGNGEAVAAPGPDLWITDGLSDGTQRLYSAETDGGLAGGGAMDLRPLGDRVLFTVDNGTEGSEPWITDGTSLGTIPLGDLNPGFASSHTRDAVAFGERVFFAAEQGSGEKLWTTDGSPEGTEIFLDIDPNWFNDFYGCPVCSPPGPPGPIFPRALTVLGNRLLFAAVTPEHGAELWASDGTRAGTALLLDLIPGPEWSDPVNLTRIGDRVIFLATDELDSVSIWRTDATPGGTSKMATLEGVHWPWDLQLEDTRFQIVEFDDLSGRFALAFDAYGAEPRLWIGSSTTGQLEEIEIPGPARDLTSIGSWLFFSSATFAEGRELWATDGSQALQQIVLRPGILGSGPRQLMAYANSLLFAADDGTSGQELWRLDLDNSGAPIGLPRLAGDLAPGAPSSSPNELFALAGSADGKLLFSADDGTHGSELWSLDGEPGDPPCIPDEFSLCANERFRLQAYFALENEPERRARAVGTTRDTGFFTFFNEDNLELAVKVLDGRPINDHHWLFYGALSDLQYRIDAVDLHTGERWESTNPRGEQCGKADIQAFPESAPSSSFRLFPDRMTGESSKRPASSETPFRSSCHDDPKTLCLQSRFEVSVSWRAERNGVIEEGVGTALPHGSDSGAFWFFDSNNVELVVKMLDGRPINDRFWFFYGALSDVEYTIRVVDTTFDLEQTYHNQAGNLCGGADVDAF